MVFKSSNWPQKKQGERRERGGGGYVEYLNMKGSVTGVELNSLKTLTNLPSCWLDYHHIVHI